MRVLGLDVATSTGWALLDGELSEWGVIDMNAPSRASDEPDGVRFRRLADRIRPHLHDVDAVFIEEAFSRNFRTAHVLGGLTAVVLVELERRGIPYSFVSPSTLKKWALGDGKGNAPKESLRPELFSRFEELGIPAPEPDIGADEIDAIWVAVYGRDHLMMTEDES